MLAVRQLPRGNDTGFRLVFLCLIEELLAFGAWLCRHGVRCCWSGGVGNQALTSSPSGKPRTRGAGSHLTHAARRALLPGRKIVKSPSAGRTEQMV